MSAMTENSRLLICDPVCVFPYGHNVAALNNFRSFVGKYFGETICLASKRLDRKIASDFNFERHFEYYYNEAMPLHKGEAQDLDLVTHNSKIRAASQDFLTLLEDYDVCGSDVICYPSVDFYSLMAISDNLDELQKRGSPKFLIRFIGVMETASVAPFSKPLDIVVAILSSLIDSGLRVELAVETPNYAKVLSGKLGLPIHVAANIELGDIAERADTDVFNVICPGSARFDKGFLDLAAIFSTVRRLDPDLKIRFTTQNLPDRQLASQLHYLSQVYAIPGVTILPSKLTAAEMKALYDTADMVLLPYAADVYEFRGSAVLIEAICAGRQCVSLEGAAFNDQLRYFGAGDVCANLEEMADRIVRLSRVPASTRKSWAVQARTRYIRDLLNSYRDWVI